MEPVADEHVAVGHEAGEQPQARDDTEEGRDKHDDDADGLRAPVAQPATE